MNQSIKLRNVNFFYDKNNLIFKNLNFDIFKGDKIALIGDSGSGKSTFLDILVGFLETQEGQLIIDGKEHNNNKISRNKLFGYVHQDVVLLNDNIINNISLEIDKKYTKDEIEEIKNYCKKAQIFDFINNLPDGLFTIIGEDGVKLSGGQRQRLGIVRALYTNPSILILDEATNSLDKKTENHFFQVLENLSKDLTIISINHKISNESFFKKMYFLKNNNFELKID
jgi:ABC-type multidrug transport system fused ATPase/permease subunit